MALGVEKDLRKARLGSTESWSAKCEVRGSAMLEGGCCDGTWYIGMYEACDRSISGPPSGCEGYWYDIAMDIDCLEIGLSRRQ